MGEYVADKKFRWIGYIGLFELQEESFQDGLKHFIDKRKGDLALKPGVVMDLYELAVDDAVTTMAWMIRHPDVHPSPQLPKWFPDVKVFRAGIILKPRIRAVT